MLGVYEFCLDIHKKYGTCVRNNKIGLSAIGLLMYDKESRIIVRVLAK